MEVSCEFWTEVCGDNRWSLRNGAISFTLAVVINTVTVNLLLRH